MKRKKNKRDKSRPARFNHHPKEIFSAVLAMVLAALMAAALIAIYYQRSTLTGEYQRDYEGQVVDKFFIPHESQTGSSVQRALLIKVKSGEQFQVTIGKDIYDRAQAGMSIKSSKQGIELSWPQP
jgi:hypothetical protein